MMVSRPALHMSVNTKCRAQKPIIYLDAYGLKDCESYLNIQVTQEFRLRLLRELPTF